MRKNYGKIIEYLTLLFEILGYDNNNNFKKMILWTCKKANYKEEKLS